MLLPGVFFAAYAASERGNGERHLHSMVIPDPVVAHQVNDLVAMTNKLMASTIGPEHGSLVPVIQSLWPHEYLGEESYRRRNIKDPLYLQALGEIRYSESCDAFVSKRAGEIRITRHEHYTVINLDDCNLACGGRMMFVIHPKA